MLLPLCHRRSESQFGRRSATAQAGAADGRAACFRCPRARTSPGDRAASKGRAHSVGGDRGAGHASGNRRCPPFRCVFREERAGRAGGHAGGIPEAPWQKRESITTLQAEDGTKEKSKPAPLKTTRVRHPRSFPPSVVRPPAEEEGGRNPRGHRLRGGMN